MILKKNVLLIYVFLLLNNALLLSQNVTHFHFGLDNGLSQETIRTFTKDDKGFLWIGTQDGLNRFDGNVFTVYKNNKKDTLSLHENYINKIFQSSDSKLWIGTATHGISYYNNKTDSFYKIGLNNGYCTGFAEDNKNRVFTTFLNGEIAVISSTSKAVKHQIITYFKKRNLQLTSILYDKQNDALYVSTIDGKLFKFKYTNNDANLKVEEVPLNSQFGSINKFIITKNYIWLGTAMGLYTYDQKTKTTKKCRVKNTDDSSPSNLFIEVIKEKNNILYVGTDNGYYELSDFNYQSGTFSTISSYFGDQKDDTVITSNRVNDILVEPDFIWIGTNKLDAISKEKPVFNLINNKSKIALFNDHVFSILKTKDYLFLGTINGLNCIDTNGNVTVITQESSQNQLAYNVIRYLIVDDKNNLWITTTRGVSVISLSDFNPKKPKIKSMYHDPNDATSLSNDKTRGLYLDHHNSVWVTTYGGGINRFTGNLKNDNFTFERYVSSPNPHSISADIAFNITQDKNETYWITTNNGLNTLKFNANYSQPIFENFLSDTQNEETLSSSSILQTFHDSKGTLWVATQDGLNKYLGNKKFKRYGMDEGLSNTFVYSILEDQQNNLWLSTNGGLFRFNPEHEVFTNYTVKDGLQSSEFNLGAQFYDASNNTLYFGGVDGCNYFNPEEVEKLDKEGSLKFTTLKVKNEPINPLLNPNIISENITTVKTITLNHDDFPVNLTFSEMDFRGNKNNSFVYKLLPGNSSWNDLNTGQDLQLIGLSKGTYTLQIQGKTRDKLWQKPPLELIIEVTPPWYTSNLAYSIYLLTFLSVVFAFYRISLQRQIAYQNSKRLQDLDELKSRFITNITHEFRTPLTIILGYLGNLKSRFSNKDEVSTSLETIEQNSNNLLNLVNQMLDLTKLEQGKLSLKLVQNDIASYIEHSVDSFMSIAEDKNIALKFESNPDIIIMDFDAEKIRQIVTNLISNAIKFSSENSMVTITVERQNEEAIVKIKDEGLGIAKDHIPYIFDRFYQIENSTSKISQGTGIGLALTKELVLLLRGNINVASKVNQGTTFTIYLPITNTGESKRIEFEPFHHTIGQTYVPELDELIIPEDTNSVLIVEDNKDMARYIASCLQPHYKVSFAKDGQEGFKKAEENIPDIIITDVMMPVMDGFELTQKLQSATKTNHIPIIMLTSKAMQEDRLEGISSGADAFLTKPFQKEELLIQMQTLIRKRQQLQSSYTFEKLSEKTQQKAPDKNVAFLNHAIEVIQEQIEDSEFNSNELAKALTMSDSQLYRKLKAISDLSTSLFIRKVRLEKSKELLKTTHLSVSEIAYATGFNDPNWFSKAFKEAYAMTPTDYRD